MATVEFDPQPQQTYAALDKAGQVRLLDAIDQALDLVEAAPGDAAARQRSFGDGLWGITVRGYADDWLIIWELDQFQDQVIIVRYLGTDPFA